MMDQKHKLGILNCFDTESKSIQIYISCVSKLYDRRTIHCDAFGLKNLKRNLKSIITNYSTYLDENIWG